MNNSDMFAIAQRYYDRGDVEKAYRYYLEAALSDGDGEAMYALAMMYYEGDYVHESYDKAGRYFGLAFENDANIEPWTLIIAGSYWENHETDNGDNIINAIKYYEAAALLGIGYGNECLGKLYYNLGEYDKAFESLEELEGINPCGFYYLGRLYDEGLGVEQDTAKAIELYKKASEFDDPCFSDDDDSRKAKLRLRELEKQGFKVQ